jgi:PAS domain-containing protein
MPQQAIEMILTRRLAAHLSMPTFMVDSDGHVLDFNPAARAVLGERLEKARSVTARELAALFEACDADGRRVGPEELPLVIALEDHHPAHARLHVVGADDAVRELAVTAVPIVGQGRRFLGAIAFFWEIEKNEASE